MKIGDPVEVHRWDHPYGVIVDANELTRCVKFEDGHVEWLYPKKLHAYDPDAPVPPLADDLAAIAQGNVSWAGLRRLAASTDDAALEAMLDRAGQWASIIRALEDCAHPDVLARGAARIDAGLASGSAEAVERARVIAWSLAPRRPAGWEARLAALQAMVEDKLAGGMLAARLMADPADAAALQALRDLAGTPNGQVAVDALVGRCPPAAAAALVPLLGTREPAAVREALAVHVGKALAPKYEGATKLPAPHLEPTWFELGTALRIEGPSGALGALVPALLAVAHPDRDAVVARALGHQPDARRAQVLAESPLLGVDAALVERCQLDRTLDRRGDAWWLLGGELASEQLDAVRAALASLEPGLAFRTKLSRSREAELVGWPGLAAFRRLDLSDTRLGSAGFKRLLAAAHLGAIEWLDLSGADIGVTGVRALAASDALPSLRDLTLAAADYDRTKWDQRCLTALVSRCGASLRGLDRLALGGWRLTELARLASSELGQRLRHVSLAHQMTLGPGARRFLHEVAEAGGRLEVLDLTSVFANYPDGSTDWNDLDGVVVRPLPTLRALILDDCHLGRAQVEALIGAWFWPQLEHLSLGRGWHDLEPLAAAPPGLASLSLAGLQHLDDALLARMAEWPLVQGLTSLDLRQTKVTEVPAPLRAIVKR